MSAWELFWFLTIIISIISFTYMSVKIVYKGLNELKEMFTKLNSE